MAPKKSTRVYALAAATMVTAGTLSYVPATFASETHNSTGAEVAAKTVQENQSLATAEVPETAASSPAAADNSPAEPEESAPTSEAPVSETVDSEKIAEPLPSKTAAEGSKKITQAEVAEAAQPHAQETAAVPAPSESASATAEENPTEQPDAATPEASVSAEPSASSQEVQGIVTEPEEAEDEDNVSEGHQNAPKVTVDKTTVYGSGDFTPMVVRVSGFYGPRVGSGIEVRIQEVNAQGRPVGKPIASGRVSAHELVDGAVNVTVNVKANMLSSGKNYAVIAASNPGARGGRLTAGTVIKIKQRAMPAPTPKAQDKREETKAAPSASPSPEASETAKPGPSAQAQESPNASAEATIQSGEAESSATTSASAGSPEATPSVSSETSAASSSASPTENAEEQDSIVEVSNTPSIRVDSARFAADAATNVVVVRGAGFTDEQVSAGIEVKIFELNEQGEAQGEALKTVTVSPSEVKDGSFTAELEVEASKLRPGYSYGIFATAKSTSGETVETYTVATVSDDSHPAPGTDNGSNVAAPRSGHKANGRGRVMSSGIQNGSSSLKMEDQDEAGSNVLSSPQRNANSTQATTAHNRSLAHTGANGVILTSALGGAMLLAGTALVVARRRVKSKA